jgi:hypothetical protein
MNIAVINHLVSVLSGIDDELLAVLNFAIEHGWTKQLPAKWQPFVAELKHVLEMLTKFTKFDFNLLGDPPTA